MDQDWREPWPPLGPAAAFRGRRLAVGAPDGRPLGPGARHALAGQADAARDVLTRNGSAQSVPRIARSGTGQEGLVSLLVTVVCWFTNPRPIAVGFIYLVTRGLALSSLLPVEGPAYAQ